MSEIPPPPPPPAPMPMGGGADISKNNLGTWALVLGIVGIVCCGPAAIAAIFVGNSSKKAAAQGLANNGNLGQIGFILGIVGVVLWVLGTIAYFTLFAATASLDSY
jgi:hypothetical protein